MKSPLVPLASDLFERPQIVTRPWFSLTETSKRGNVIFIQKQKYHAAFPEKSRRAMLCQNPER